MILGFKPQFKKPIKEGRKIHTIREDKLNRWEKSKMIHMATGVRTKKYEQFGTRACSGVQPIDIKWMDGKAMVRVNLRWLEPEEVQELAINDGFKNLDQFLHWFREDFSGKIIHWTNKRY